MDKVGESTFDKVTKEEKESLESLTKGKQISFINRMRTRNREEEE